MSNIKISELDQAGALTGFELMPIVQDNLTVRTTTNQLKAFAGIAISNDIIGDAASTTLAPSVNAIKTYTDGLVVGLLNDRGNYTPDVVSPGAYPSSGGSGVGGAIQKGNIWFIDGNGFLGTTAVVIGASVRALVSSPSPTTDSDWDILDASLIQSDLQSVLNAGNSANGTITLTNGSETSTLSKDAIQFDTTAYVNAANYNAYTFQITNNGGDYILGSTDSLKVYDVTTNNSTEIKYDSLNYNNFGFVGKLSTNVLTSSQLWSFPNASGTIALANNVWNATGNAGTVAGANFLGTTDAVDLVINTNNLERIRVANTGGVIISDLAGTGTRTVVASPTGQLSTTISSSGWSTLGNASTSALTNFIGTTDNVALVFKANNIERLRIYSTNGLIENSGAGFSSISSSGSNIEARNSSGTKSIQLNTLLANPKISITSGSYSGSISLATLTTSQTYTLPDASGTIALTTTVTLQSVLAGTNKNLTNGINLQGTNAGLNLDVLSTDVNIFGTLAGNTNTGSNINAFGRSAAQYNNGSYVNALGYNTAATNNGSNINAFGRNAAQANSGSYVNAMGYGAAKNNLGSDTNALGTNAALDNQGQYVNAIGNQAVSSNTGGNTGNHVNGIGQFAAFNNAGTYINALGLDAANGNMGDNVNAFGYQAAMNNGVAATYVNAFGCQAAKGNSGGYVNAIGSGAAENNTGSDINAFGNGSGSGNTINGATIFSNASLPSYANYAAASAAITVLAGGSAGCTYLYHDQATNSIGAVRL